MNSTRQKHGLSRMMRVILNFNPRGAVVTLIPVNKKDWLLVINAVFIVWIADQLTKQWAMATISGLEFHGPLGFVLVRNPGAILGAFSHLPPLLRVVSL